MAVLLCLLARARAVQHQPVAHISVEQLQVTVLFALRFERCETDLLVTTDIAAVQGAETTPFGAIYGEVAGMPQRRAEQIGAYPVTCIPLVAVGTGQVQLPTLGVKMLFAPLVSLLGALVMSMAKRPTSVPAGMVSAPGWGAEK